MHSPVPGLGFWQTTGPAPRRGSLWQAKVVSTVTGHTTTPQLLTGATVARPVTDEAVNPASAPPALECNAIFKKFGDVPAVQGFNLIIPQGQVLALLGPSGCGKTTALRLIAGFDEPDSGSIAIGGHRVWDQGHNVAPDKRRVGMVFQEGALFPHLTVEQNVAYGLPRKDRRTNRIHQVLNLVGLEHLRHRMPHELSGGQQQRVALARALAPQPQILLLDEPFSNLDPGLREQVRRDTMEILRASQTTSIFVTHDQDEALLVGDTIAVMNHGRIEQVASPEAIFHSPATRFVAEFIGLVDFLPAQREGNRLVTQVGSTEWPEACPSDSALEVMVRPDCLECYPSDQGQGTVIEREFRGAFFLYRIALSSGHTVRCLHSHTEEYPVGSSVAVNLRRGHELRPFHGGQALAP